MSKLTVSFISLYHYNNLYISVRFHVAAITCTVTRQTALSIHYNTVWITGTEVKGRAAPCPRDTGYRPYGSRLSTDRRCCYEKKKLVNKKPIKLGSKKE